MTILVCLIVVARQPNQTPRSKVCRNREREVCTYILKILKIARAPKMSMYSGRSIAIHAIKGTEVTY